MPLVFGAFDHNTAPLFGGAENGTSGENQAITITLGAISGLTEVTLGTHEATITAGTVAGVATVEVTIDAVTASVSITLVPGPVASVTVAPGVDTLVADGADQTTLVVTSTDASGNSTSGDNQAITANLGTASGLAEAAPGVLDATFTAGDQPGVATVGVTIDGITGTASITLVSPAVASVEVTVGSDTLAADGLSQTTIAVASADVLGNPTSGDNQTINTNLGVVSGLAATGPGAHEATFTSGTDAGVATLEVMIDAVTASVSISLLPGSVSSVNIALGSNTLLAGGVEQTTVTATSTDASGNPISSTADPDRR